MRVIALALVSAVQAGAVVAEGFAFPSLDTVQGVSRVFNNDFLGDGKDRWRTGVL